MPGEARKPRGSGCPAGLSGVADIILGLGLHDTHDLLDDIDCRSVCEHLAGSDTLVVTDNSGFATQE